MKTKEEILKHHLRHIQFEKSELTFANVCAAMEEYASQQISALQQENEKLKEQQKQHLKDAYSAGQARCIFFEDWYIENVTKTKD